MIAEGDSVEVYMDPFSRTKLDGPAVVRKIRRVTEEPDMIIYNTLVNFPEDGPDVVVHRTVVEPKEAKA
jgi:hypothetical protein